MSGEPTPGDAAALEALRQTALATKKSADDAQAALLAADPNSGPPPSGGPPPTQPRGIDLVTLEAVMASAIRKSTEGLRDGIGLLGAKAINFLSEICKQLWHQLATC